MAQQDDRVLPKEALQILTRLGQKNRHYTLGWWTKESRKETIYAYQELRKAREKLEAYFATLPTEERATNKEKIGRWLFNELDEELRLIENMFGVLKSAYTGNREYEHVVRKWKEAITDADIYTRMKATEQQLKRILEAPNIEALATQATPIRSRKYNRRQALRMFGIAATAALSTSTLAKLVKEQPLDTSDYTNIEAVTTTQQETDTLGELPQSGYHLQMNAYKSRENAIKESEELNRWLSLEDSKKDLQTRVYLPSVTRHDDPARHKVISVEAFQTVEMAVSATEEAFINKNINIEKIGIIHIDEQGRITWSKLQSLKRYLKKKYHLSTKGMAIDAISLSWFILMVRRSLKIYEELYQVKVDERLVWAIMLEESHFNTAADSHAGAMGLMQLMPAMWKRFHGISRLFPHKRKGRVPYEEPVLEKGILQPEGKHRNEGCKPCDYRMNIDAGVQMLCYLHRKYWNTSERTKRVIAAYNAGETMVNKGIYPTETRNYIKKVSSTYAYFHEEERKRREPQMTEKKIVQVRLEVTFNRLKHSQVA